jgi:cobalt-zinc-cadmium efflux system protein
LPETTTNPASGVHEHGELKSANERNLAVALGLILVYMTGEVVMAFFAHSLALLADAGHMLTDAGALGAAMWAIRLARRPSTPLLSYGLKRAEILAAALNGVTLLVVGVVIVVEAGQRLMHPSVVHGVSIIVVASVGIVVNTAATFVLARGDLRSLNMRGAFQHILTDLYGIVATVIAGVVILVTGWQRADSLASLVVAALVLRAAVGLLGKSGHVLLEGTPESIDLEEVRRHLEGVPDVDSVHDLHAWSLTSDVPALTAHVVITDHALDEGGFAGMLDQLQACVAAHFDIEHSTFQLEADRHSEHEKATHV